ncbi:MAG: hypothetical protein R3266_03550, partial [Gemmatimonadota bacterium]|nr:hypothetical protein [Gemmatimonadota bacterium]
MRDRVDVGQRPTFLDDLRRRAGALGARIGFPEAAEERTREAIARLGEGGWVDPVPISASDGGLDAAVRARARD